MPARKRQRKERTHTQELAVGTDFGHGRARPYTFLHLVDEPQIDQQIEE